VRRHAWTIESAAGLTPDQAIALAAGQTVKAEVFPSNRTIYCRRCWISFTPEKAREECGPAVARR
jgi:hypothetical protein